MHVKKYFEEVGQIASRINHTEVEQLVKDLVSLRDHGGRLFMLGVGGSAANCSHAVNDFRKLCGIEAYSPVDNVSELTARTNDEGWETVFSSWLAISKANNKDAIFILSVGGGDVQKNISTNLVAAVKEAKIRGLKIFGIVGREGSYTKEVGNTVIVVPMVDRSRITPHSEAFQAVIWHCLVSHPSLQIAQTKW